MRMAGPLPVSLVVITRDAAADIQECLLSAQICADALVVDSGRGDHTVEAARRCGARVVSRAWLGFGPQKQFAVQEARYDWVLCLDGRRAAVAEAPRIDRRACSRTARRRIRRMRSRAAIASLGRWLSHGEGYPDWVTRLFDRRRARWSDDPVHEQVVADGPVGRLEGDSAARVGRIARALRREAEPLHDTAGRCTARERQRSSALTMALSPLARFVRFYVLRLGFLDGAPGSRTSRSAHSRVS
jgi:glycosyltransferase involved in cell wall biosynthesis